VGRAAWVGNARHRVEVRPLAADDQLVGAHLPSISAQRILRLEPGPVILATALSRRSNLAAAINTTEQAVKLSLDQEVDARLELASHDASRLLDAEQVLSQILAVQPELESARLPTGHRRR
jgi:hypothetical protein